jgi:flagellar biosynthetic protein FliO
MTRQRHPFLMTIALAAALTFAAAAIAPGTVWALTDADIASLSDEPAAPETQRVHTNAPGPIDVLTRMSLALGVVFGLMWLVAAMARKWLPQVRRKGLGGSIEVMSTRSIGGRRSLMLVRTRERTLLLGVTPQSIQTLSEFEDEAGDWQAAARHADLDPEKTPAPSKSGGTTTLERFGA